MTIFNFLKLINKKHSNYLSVISNNNVFYLNNNLIGYSYETKKLCYYGIRVIKIINQSNIKLYIDELKEYSDGTRYPRKSYWFELYQEYTREETSFEAIYGDLKCILHGFYIDNIPEFFKTIFRNKITEGDIIDMINNNIEMQELMIELI